MLLQRALIDTNPRSAIDYLHDTSTQLPPARRLSPLRDRLRELSHLLRPLSSDTRRRLGELAALRPRAGAPGRGSPPCLPAAGALPRQDPEPDLRRPQPGGPRSLPLYDAGLLPAAAAIRQRAQS